MHVLTHGAVADLVMLFGVASGLVSVTGLLL